MHGDLPRHLDYNSSEHPVVLQLGGSEPADLARCAELAQKWSYDEIDLTAVVPQSVSKKVLLVLA